MKVERLTIIFILFFAVFTDAAERVQLKVVDGIPCAEFRIRNGRNQLKANMMIDLGMESPLVMLSDAAGELDVAEGDKLSLYHKGGVLSGIEYMGGDIPGLDEFTRDNASELNDIAVWGILGRLAFCRSGENISLVIEDGYLEYGDDIELPESDPIALEMQSDRLIYNLELDDGYDIPAMVCTSEYITSIDVDTASLGGSEYGIFPGCKVGSYSLNDYTAVRSIDSYSDQLQIADMMLANSFWQNFTVYFDGAGKNIFLDPLPDGIVSDIGCQLYYNAELDNDFDAIADYVNNNRNSPVADIALEKLLAIAISNNDRDMVDRAVTVITSQAEPLAGAKILASFARSYIDSGNNLMAEILLSYARELQLKSGQSPYLQAEIDSYLGYLAMENDDLAMARRHLLSSLFLQPSIPFTNYLMGQYYLRTEKYARAWSRFLTASLADEPYDPAINQIKELTSINGFTDVFSIEDACDFLDGRIYDQNLELTAQAKMLKLRAGEFTRDAILKLEGKNAR